MLRRALRTTRITGYAGSNWWMLTKDVGAAIVGIWILLWISKTWHAEPTGESSPLATGPHAEDDPVEDLSEIRRATSRALAVSELLEDRLDPLPQR